MEKTTAWWLSSPFWQILCYKWWSTNRPRKLLTPFCHYLYTKAPLVCGLTFIPFCFWQNCSSFVKLHGDHECTTIFKCCQKCWFGLRSDSATVGLNIVVLKPFLCSFGLMFALFFLLENKSSQSLLSSRLQQVFLEDFSSLLLHPISPQSSQAFQDLLQRSIPIAGWRHPQASWWGWCVILTLCFQQTVQERLVVRSRSVSTTGLIISSATSSPRMVIALCGLQQYLLSIKLRFSACKWLKKMWDSFHMFLGSALTWQPAAAEMKA